MIPALTSCRLCARQLLRAAPQRSFSQLILPKSTSLPRWTNSARDGVASGSRLLRGIVLTAVPPTEEPDEPLPEGEDKIDLTENAIAQIVQAQAKLGLDTALRVSVESGGCHGYQYKMEVTTKVEDDDYVFQPPSSTARLLVDHSSLGLISGSTIDYATELIGSSFRITGNPHASDKGGCGCGVSWELKE